MRARGSGPMLGGLAALAAAAPPRAADCGRPQTQAGMTRCADEGPREARCAFEGSSDRGGSMQPMAMEGCAASLTAHRTAERTSDLAGARDPSKC